MIKLSRVNKATLLALISPPMAYGYVNGKQRGIGMFLVDFAVIIGAIYVGYYVGGGAEIESPEDFEYSIAYPVAIAIVEVWHAIMIFDVRRLAKKYPGGSLDETTTSY